MKLSSGETFLENKWSEQNFALRKLEKIRKATAQCVENPSKIVNTVDTFGLCWNFVFVFLGRPFVSGDFIIFFKYQKFDIFLKYQNLSKIIKFRRGSSKRQTEANMQIIDFKSFLKICHASYRV
jgi:hypothetical protein